MISVRRGSREIILPSPNVLLPEETEVPQIANQWVDGATRWIRVEMRHDHVREGSSCNGYVTTAFRWREGGNKDVCCQVCGQKELLNVGVTQIEMGLW